MGTYREVIRDSMRVRLKHKERSCGDYRISKQIFQALENKCRPLAGMEPTCRVNRRGRSIIHRRPGRYIFIRNYKTEPWRACWPKFTRDDTRQPKSFYTMQPKSFWTLEKGTDLRTHG
ncbi:hypothetical protein YC2023_089614 [Brassica napus]